MLVILFYNWRRAQLKKQKHYVEAMFTQLLKHRTFLMWCYETGKWTQSCRSMMKCGTIGTEYGEYMELQDDERMHVVDVRAGLWPEATASEPWKTLAFQKTSGIRMDIKTVPLVLLKVWEFPWSKRKLERDGDILLTKKTFLRYMGAFHIHVLITYWIFQN